MITTRHTKISTLLSDMIAKPGFVYDYGQTGKSSTLLSVMTAKPGSVYDNGSDGKRITLISDVKAELSIIYVYCESGHIKKNIIQQYAMFLP